MPPTIGSPSGFHLHETGWSAFGVEPDLLLLPASTIKAVTFAAARRVVTDAMLSDTVTVLEEDLSSGSTARLQAGDIITWNDLFYGMMLPSGNDAANAIARSAGQIILDTLGGTGTPRQRFLAYAQQMVDELGFTGALITSAAGYPDNASRLTVRHLCELALRWDQYMVTVAGTRTWQMTITGVNARTYTVTHTVDPDGDVKFPEMVAAKSGTISGSVMIANLAMLWDDDRGRHATAVMGGWPQHVRYDDTRAIIDYVRSQPLPPAPPGRWVDTWAVVGGTRVPIVAAWHQDGDRRRSILLP